jgi:hypothetical protein
MLHSTNKVRDNTYISSQIDNIYSIFRFLACFDAAQRSNIKRQNRRKKTTLSNIIDFFIDFRQIINRRIRPSTYASSS